MKWSIRKQVDGVITDDPKMFLDVCKKYRGEKPRLKWRELGMMVLTEGLALPVSLFLRWQRGSKIDEKEMRGLLGEASKR